MRTRLWTLALLAAFWSGGAAALTVDSFETTPYIGGFGLFEIPDSSKHEKDSAAFRGLIGIPLDASSSIEFSYFDSRLVRKPDHRPNFDSGLMADYAYDFGLFGFGNKFLPNFKPYLLAGFGAERDDEYQHHYYHLAADAGGGLLFPISIGKWNWGWAVRTEARVVAEYVDKTDLPDYVDKHFPIDYQVGVGLTIPLSFIPHLGSSGPIKTPECATSVVDPVTGRSDCVTDSDGDGVSDDKDQCPGTPAGTRVDEKGCPVDTGGDEDGDGVMDGDDRCPHTPAGEKVDAKGCAVEQTVILEGVNFETDSAVLTSEATKVLDNVAQSLSSQPNVNMEVGGHTDNVGSQSYNVVLSEERAESVRQYLIGKGIDGARLTAQGFGEFKPITSNATAKGRAQNRRVEFRIILR